MALLTPSRVTAPPSPDHRPRTRRERRRLARQDRLSAQLARLRTVEQVLDRAQVLVAAGWVQGAWFGYTGPDGPRVSHLPGGLTSAASSAADRFCLVSAVHAATGQVTGRAAGPRLARADRPLADRAVDTAWRTLEGADGGPACPPPEVRALRRIDLTRWNDAAGRTGDDVRRLLAAAAATARRDRERACLALVTDG